jgi:hypothetical protein
MKLLLTTILVLTVAVVPAFAQEKSPTAGAGAPTSGATGGDSMTLPKADTAAPSASPTMGIGPATKDDCAKGSWAQFKDQKFKGEAECVAFVEKHGKSQ